MNLTRSDSAASLQLSSQRKRDLLHHFEANRDELDRWREFNAAYHEDDRKFMQFLISPGKRVLELGCGRGDLLAALKPSCGVGIDFGAKTIANARVLHPELHFILGDAEARATLAYFTQNCILFWATRRRRQRWPLSRDHSITS